MRLAEIAEKIGGDLIGDGNFDVRDIAELNLAGPDMLSWAESKKQMKKPSAAGALIVPPGVEPGRPGIRCPNPKLGFVRAIALLRPQKPPPPGIHPSAIIDESAKIGARVSVGPAASIGPGAEIGEGCHIGAGAHIGEEVTLGSDCVVHPNCVLYPGVSLGRRVVLHAGVVIGSDGFGYVPGDRGGVEKFPQTGTVVIEDDVEIGSNTVVDRASLGETRIKRGAKIDNLVQIAHNVIIGEECLLASQVGISGSVTLGRGVIMGGNVGVADHVEIGDGAIFGARSGISKSLDGGKTYLDAPAVEISDARRRMVVYGRLPEIAKRLREVEKKIEELES
ncbi:MAG: UDP-3-O-(3-hydroxymyristoyl)glucosamine N-acyltransferase [Nitrospinota bacterium]